MPTPKKDNNHNEIVGYFEDKGCSVLDLSSVGNGCPDILVSINGVLTLVEIKNPKTFYGRSGLNEMQTAWAEWWSGGVVFVGIAYSVIYFDKK